MLRHLRFPLPTPADATPSSRLPSADLHHAKFECNYGSPFSASIDMALGTFREALVASSYYTGEWSEGAARRAEHAEGTPAQRKRSVWSQQSYLGVPGSVSDGVYTLFCAALFPLMLWAAVLNHKGGETGAGMASAIFPDRVETLGGWPVADVVACVVAYAPIGLALLLARLSGDRMSWRWPFHKEKVLGTFGVFLLLGWLACLLPTYHAVKLISEAQ